MAFITSRRLLRLYPGIWRLRYGHEFLALLEESPLTRAVVIDTIRAAAWEWLRWTRIGRVALAFVIAAPLAAVEFALDSRWPAPLAGVWRRQLSNWSDFWVMALLFCLPYLVGISLLLIAGPPGRERRPVRFGTQILILSVSALAMEWLLAMPIRLQSWHLARGYWLESGVFIAMFLVWLFNIEGGARQRYLRRLAAVDGHEG